ncbi:hypothetical protein PULV_a1120 [Pseudoalteromonas ulvae UL12]|nr:hypothetical protein [Pseudoalteromonas ulvae UL12]
MPPKNSRFWLDLAPFANIYCILQSKLKIGWHFKATHKTIANK